MVENNIVGVCCMSKNSPYFDNIFVQDHFSSTYFLRTCRVAVEQLSTIVLCFYLNKEFLEIYSLDVLMLIFYFYFLVKDSLIEYLVLMDESKVT